MRPVTQPLRPWTQRLTLGIAVWLLLVSAMASAQEQVPLIKRLDGPTRAKVLAALAGLIILGFAMVLLTWLGARVTRRYMARTPYFRPAVRPATSDWTPQPLLPGDQLADDADSDGEH